MKTDFCPTLADQFTRVTQALFQHSVQATVEYYGSGDSGDSFEVFLSRDCADTTVSIDGANLTLSDAAAHVMENLVARLHSGYENNSGGGGEVKWHPDGMMDFACHHNCVAEFNDSATVIPSSALTPTTKSEANSINAKRILSAMEEAKVERIVVEYEGGGDSGGITDVALEPDCTIDLEIWVACSGWKAGDVTFSLKKLLLEDAAKHVADDMVESHFAGYEINEGGRGEVIFDSSCENVKIEHVSYAEEQEGFKLVLVDPAMDATQIILMLNQHSVNPMELEPLNEAQAALYKRMQDEGLDALLIEYCGPDRSEDLPRD